MTDPLHQYDDIIDLPHHVSETRPRMPMIDRAAQFSPFAALTGYDAAIVETARLTDAKRELSGEQKLEIGRALSGLARRLGSDPAVTVTYFVPDSRKSGGSYRTLTGTAAKLDELSACLTLTDGTVIPYDDILEIE